MAVHEPYYNTAICRCYLTFAESGFFFFFFQTYQTSCWLKIWTCFSHSVPVTESKEVNKVGTLRFAEDLKIKPHAGGCSQEPVQPWKVPRKSTSSRSGQVPEEGSDPTARVLGLSVTPDRVGSERMGAGGLHS